MLKIAPIAAARIMGAAMTSCVSLLTMLAVPAHAHQSACVFTAREPFSGKIVAEGSAFAAKQKWACNRAERRCKRELKRKKRKGLNRGELAAKCKRQD